MRKLVIGIAMASTALATPALARDKQWYVGFDGGVMIVEDIDFEFDTGVGSVLADTKTGYDFGATVGYDFGSFRLEAEASVREAEIKNLTVDSVGLVSGPIIPPLSAAGSYPAHGSAGALSFMVNGMFDFGDDDGLQGFVGAGAGIARVKLDGTINTMGPGAFDDSDSGFAWQALAGIRAPISKNWDAGLKYRYFNAPKVDIVDLANRNLRTDYKSHSILGSIVYNFGGKEAPPPPPPTYIPPPPPPRPVPPPPPPAVQCNSGPYIVFFDWDKSNITQDAATVLDNAISEYKVGCKVVPVMLAGYTDSSGSTQYNLGLSARRNQAVRSYMVSNGIPDSVISSQAFGEADQRVPTADGVREPQNRRVQITYGPGSGY